jgi:hypothetical protein
MSKRRRTKPWHQSVAISRHAIERRLELEGNSPEQIELIFEQKTSGKNSAYHQMRSTIRDELRDGTELSIKQTFLFKHPGRLRKRDKATYFFHTDMQHCFVVDDGCVITVIPVSENLLSSMKQIETQETKALVKPEPKKAKPAPEPKKKKRKAKKTIAKPNPKSQKAQKGKQKEKTIPTKKRRSKKVPIPQIAPPTIMPQLPLSIHKPTAQLIFIVAFSAPNIIAIKKYLHQVLHFIITMSQRDKIEIVLGGRIFQYRTGNIKPSISEEELTCGFQDATIVKHANSKCTERPVLIITNPDDAWKYYHLFTKKPNDLQQPHTTPWLGYFSTTRDGHQEGFVHKNQLNPS